MRLGPPYLIMSTLVVFVSILIHEMGHALVARALGCHVVETVLHALGGLAIYLPGRHHTHGKSILISLAGPGAGFLLWGLLEFVLDVPIQSFAIRHLDEKFAHLILFGLEVCIFVNKWWGIINLLPVLPLDGGNVCRGVCESLNRYGGERTARKISVGVAGLVAVYFFREQNTFTGILFLSFAINNWQSLQRD